MMESPAKRIQLMAFVVRPENIERYVQTAEQLFGITFELMHGPTIIGVHDQRVCYVDYNSGIEIVAPLDSANPACAEWVEFLEQKGEGLYAFVFGDSDLAGSADRARALGFPVADEFVMPVDESENRRYFGSWSNIVDTAQQVHVGPFLGLELIFASTNFTARAKQMTSSGDT